MNDNDEVEVEVGPGKVSYALAYARHGLRVFPAHWLRPDGTCSYRNPKKCGNPPGKHPIEEKWQESATTDESKIRWWWSRNPEANIGVLCDTITVVDVDPRHGGDDTLHKLEAEHGELPPTPTVITHSGGTHLYFKHVPGLQNAVAFAPGLDIRTLSPKGKVGLVIGVGSVNTGGRYEWDASATIGDVPLAEMTLWLIEIIKAGQGKRGKRSRGAEFSRVTGAPIVNGTRDDALTSAAGRLKWEGKSAEETFEQLKKVRDARVEGGAEEFSDDQVLAKVESVFAYADDDSLQAIPGAPDCYHMNSKGVWYTPPPNKKEEIPDPIWVCSPLSVTAYTRSSDSEDWGRLALFRDADGRPHEWPIPMGLLAADGKELRTRLLDLGLGISTTPAARWALLAYINRCTSVVRVRSVTAPGWHLVEYVLPDCAVGLGGAPGAERVLWQNASAVEHALNVKGTIKEWQENVGKPCAGNSRLVFGVSMAAAAPLLYLLNEESGGFNYVGDSSIGKTTAQRVAGSFCGGSDTPGGYLRSWRATSNGLEAMAQLHCDGLLVLDEMSQVEPREAGQVVYMLGNGQGKSRSNRDGSGQRIKTWRLLALSSGEITLAGGPFGPHD